MANPQERPIDTDAWDLAAGPLSEQATEVIAKVQAGETTAAEGRSIMTSFVNDLAQYFNSYDTARLIGFISALFWRTPTAPETDYTVRARLQYLYALQVRSGVRHRSTSPSIDVMFSVLNRVRTAFELNRVCLAAETTDGSREGLLRLLVRVEQLEERNNGFVQHLWPMVGALAEEISDLFVEEFRWHPLDLWTLASEAARVTEKRVKADRSERSRRFGGAPPTDQHDPSMVSALNFDYLAFVWNPASIASLVYTCPDDPGSIERAARLLEDLRLRPSNETEILVPDAVPARSFIGFNRIEEGWFLPQPLLLAQYWIEIMGDLIRTRASSKLTDAWSKARTNVTESLPLECLKRAFPDADVYGNVKTPEDGDGETDCLVVTRDRRQAILVEAKGAQLAASARRGGPARLETFTRKEIEKAARQIDRVRKLLLAGPVKIAPGVGRRLIIDLDLLETVGPRVPGVIVTLERVDALALLEKGAVNPRGEWVVCLADFIMVTEAFQEDRDLLAYIEDRYTLESVEDWFVYEKDALGFYLETGGFFNRSTFYDGPRLGPGGNFEEFTFSDRSFIVGYGQLLDEHFGWAVADGLPGASSR